MPPVVSSTATIRGTELKSQDSINPGGPKQEAEMREHLFSPIRYNKTFLEKLMMVVTASGKTLLQFVGEDSFEVETIDKEDGS